MTKFTFRHLKIFPILFVIYSLPGLAKIQEFETTRMKSTAGTGVGSILMDEATILNPAPIAFFNVGSVYLSKGSAENRESNTVVQDSDHLGIIVSDAKGNTAGSFSYQSQSFGNQKRKRLAAALSSPIRKKSAMGVSLRRTTDEVIGGDKNEYLQTVVGITHAVSQEFTIGFVAFDPLKKRADDSLGIFGGQYVYQDFISIMADAGANYYKELGESFLYRGALQFKLMDDFYARAGYFRDMGKEEKGTGAGLGWVQPRLVIEAAIKNTENVSNKNIAKVSETSFSLSYRF
ncbi:MAG: hypothetical protein CME70_07660 [Halobacteriovorax sp.]|nr:hypothetical protein [Halobacteriovorax sp.]|tara:strand:+ start:304992 stop:305861 length:870 start_codon:yes stop_codon:yes gene_type:complete